MGAQTPRREAQHASALATEVGPPASLTHGIMPTDVELVRARRRLRHKAVVIGVAALAGYWGLVVADTGLLVRMVSAAVLILAATSMATGVMHDANHGAFSRSSRVNRVMGYTLDLLGGSSWLWRFKHNVLHHANTNVVGVDSDIEQAPFARLAPQQPWRWWHRYQHVYLWFLYGILALRWFLLADFVNLARNRIGPQPLVVRRRRRDLALMIVGKLVHLSWAVLIPMTLHPWWGVVTFYLVCSWIVGFQLAMIFQLAHCVDIAEFVPDGTPRRGPDFQLHQLRTTVDIRCRVPGVRWFVRWMMGGLDYQIEHHMAPALPHTVYPMLGKRLASECAARGLPYRCHASISAAVRSHVRWLRLMGQAPAASPVA
jgi:linoleoyl-CoA desaturase